MRRRRRQCLDCRKLTVGSRCSGCRKKREQARLRERPWLRLYDLPDWRRVKWQVHKRDGYRCTFADKRGRCAVTRDTGTIEAHHVKKVAQLWLDAKRDFAEFMVLALDSANIVTLCYKHHVLADRPKNLGMREKTRFSADRKPRIRSRR